MTLWITLVIFTANKVPYVLDWIHIGEHGRPLKSFNRNLLTEFSYNESSVQSGVIVNKDQPVSQWIIINSNMTSFKRFESKPVLKIILIYDRLNLWRHRQFIAIFYQFLHIRIEIIHGSHMYIASMNYFLNENTQSHLANTLCVIRYDTYCKLVLIEHGRLYQSWCTFN